MKKRLLTIFAIMVLSMTAFCQIVTVHDDLVRVSDENGNLIANNYFPGLAGATGGYDKVAIWYYDGKVDIRDTQLFSTASNYFTGLVGLSITGKTTGDDKEKGKEAIIVLYYKGGKVETRDEYLTLINTKY